MKKRILLLPLTLLLFLAGCQGLYEQAQREKIDKEILVKTAAIHHDMLPARLGLFDGFNEGKEGTLNVGTTAILGKLREISTVDPNSMTEYELCYSWGLQANLLEKLIKAAIEIARYLP